MMDLNSFKNINSRLEDNEEKETQEHCENYETSYKQNAHGSLSQTGAKTCSEHTSSLENGDNIFSEDVSLSKTGAKVCSEHAWSSETGSKIFSVHEQELNREPPPPFPSRLHPWHSLPPETTSPVRHEPSDTNSLLTLNHGADHVCSEKPQADSFIELYCNSSVATAAAAAPPHLQFADDRFDDPEDDKFLSELASSTNKSKEPNRSNLKRKLDQTENHVSTKQIKKRVRFDNITVYYFRRVQGFTCVPSQGGSTLGMEASHFHAARFTLHEHAAEQRRAQRLRLQQLRAERLVRAARAHHSDSDSEASSALDSDPELDSYYFLQPVPARRRRALLRAAGVRRIHPGERDECRALRASREMCGCSCAGACAGPTCACAAAGISCQVDRAGFPCACASASCGNPAGRVEFNPLRVQTHLVRTLVSLGLQPDGAAPPPPAPPRYEHGLCELSYRYAGVDADMYHTYPLSSFEEFAHPTHVSMFSEYAQQVYQAEVGPGTIAQDVSSSPPPASRDRADVSEPTEDFGEIIKKTMLESVIG